MITSNLRTPPLVDVPGSISQRTSPEGPEAGRPEATQTRLADVLRQAQQREDCNHSAEIQVVLKQAIGALAVYATA